MGFLLQIASCIWQPFAVCFHPQMRSLSRVIFSCLTGEICVQKRRLVAAKIAFEHPASALFLKR